MLTSPSSWIIIWPQFVNPTPAAVGDVRFRRAMAHALDRQQMVDTFMAGVSSVAHSYLGPDEADYQAIETVVPRYAYDPQRAIQLVESMGYTRSPDGALRDGAGQRLALEIRTTTGDKLRERLLLSTADSWQRIGLAVEPIIVSRQLAQDQEYRATFPAFELSRNPNTARDFPNLQSRAARLPENGFRGTGGTNYARYMNPEFDAWIDRYFVTIPSAERQALARQIVAHMADQVTVIGVLHSTDQHMLANRLRNATNRSQGSTETWNAHDWDIQ
jgi:peptide/nickel transport system substrate-binding protein